MKLKRLTALLLALCMIFALAACADNSGEAETETTTAPEKEETKPTETEPKETEPTETEPTGTEPVEVEGTSTPLLYKVSDEEGNVVWLFGSIHVGEEYYYPLPDYVNEAYEAADSLAVECDIIVAAQDLSMQMDALSQLVYTDGTAISDHISQELYQRSVEILEENDSYMSVLDYYYPIMWSSLIDNFIYPMIGADSELGVDMHLLERAHEDGKQIVEIESMAFQYGMMAGFSEELQILLLESSIDSYENLEEYEAELKAMMEAWAAGDEETFAEMMAEDEVEFSGPEEEALYEEYNNEMVLDRNISMADFAEDALASGEEVFICVGAAHVVGEGAMADLLSERGYTVEIVE